MGYAALRLALPDATRRSPHDSKVMSLDAGLFPAVIQESSLAMPLPLLIAGSGFSVVGLALPPRSVNQLSPLRITGPYNMHATEQAPE